MLCRSGLPTRGLKVMTEPFPSSAPAPPGRIGAPRSWKGTWQCPRPKTSCPFGQQHKHEERIQRNIQDAAQDNSDASLLGAADATKLNWRGTIGTATVGTPPKTIDPQGRTAGHRRRYSPPAPRSCKMGSINTARLREKGRRNCPVPAAGEKALTRLASSSRSCPSRREISEPPPTPAKPARPKGQVEHRKHQGSPCHHVGVGSLPHEEGIRHVIDEHNEPGWLPPGVPSVPAPLEREAAQTPPEKDPSLPASLSPALSAAKVKDHRHSRWLE